MHIVNAMFAKGLGGIEQSFTDYTEALLLQNNDVTTFTHPEALINPQLEKIDNENLSLEKIVNSGKWDYLAVKKIRKILKKVKPDAVITHGNRAVGFFKKAARGICPVIGVAHNYKTDRFGNLDAAFSITNDLKQHIEESSGLKKKNIYIVPNMIRITHEPDFKKVGQPPVIGVMGRFVEKKAIDIFIAALNKLSVNGVQFKALIAGNGEEEEKLKQLSKQYGLTNRVQFLGWVKNKHSFYDSIDIFCLPSLHEPFGIVLLEAFAHKKAVVTTDSEGPLEIAKNEKDCIMVKKGNVESLAYAIKQLIADKEKAEEIAEEGFENVQKNYDINVVSKKIQKNLKVIVKNYDPKRKKKNTEEIDEIEEENNDD